MPIETRIALSGSCEIVATEWESDSIANDVSLEYIEHCSDHYHSDNETSIDISKEQPIAMIAMFQKHFNI